MTRIVKRTSVHSAGTIAALSAVLEQKIQSGDIPPDAMLVEAEVDVRDEMSFDDGWVHADSSISISIEWPA